MIDTQTRLDAIDLFSRLYIEVDSENAAGWAQFFAEDGVFVAPYGEYPGRKAVQEFMEEHVRQGKEKGVRHFLTNFVTDAQGADCRVRFYILKLNVAVGPGFIATAGGDAVVRKTADGWRIARFKLAIDSGSLPRTTGK